MVQSEDTNILQLRSKVPIVKIKTICNYHKAKLDTKFSSLIKKCSNPFQLHSAVVTKGLRIISQELYSKAGCLEQKVVPGKKLCLACQKKVTELQQTSEEEKQSSEGSDFSESTSKEDDRAASSGLQ